MSIKMGEFVGKEEDSYISKLPFTKENMTHTTLAIHRN